jgi:hypothetical protein
MNNNYPFKSNGLIPPMPTHSFVGKDVLYKDTLFERDDRMKKAVANQENSYVPAYKPYMNVEDRFNIPANSKDFIETKEYKSFSKDELKDQYIANVYNTMTDQNIKQNINESIFGSTNSSSSKVSLYKPVYTSIDLSTNNYLFNNHIIERKFEPYQGDMHHSFKSTQKNIVPIYTPN